MRRRRRRCGGALTRIAGHVAGRAGQIVTVQKGATCGTVNCLNCLDCNTEALRSSSRSPVRLPRCAQRARATAKRRGSCACAAAALSRRRRGHARYNGAASAQHVLQRTAPVWRVTLHAAPAMDGAGAVERSCPRVPGSASASPSRHCTAGHGRGCAPCSTIARAVLTCSMASVLQERWGCRRSLEHRKSSCQ